MAVENQPAPAQPVSPKLTMSRDFVQVIGAAAALAAVIIAGMALVMSITVAPIREDIRLLRMEMQRGFEGVDAKFEGVDADFKSVDAQFKAVDDEFKAIREDLADIRERLTRVETLLEQGAGGRPQAPESP